MKSIKIIFNKIIQPLFIVMCFIMAMPSILYLVKYKTILDFEPYFQFLYNAPIERLGQAILFGIILIIISVLYFLIIKKRNELFANNKEVLIFIAIVAIIFAFVLPFMSSDVFYYMGIGRIDFKYNQNPYYVSIKDFVDTGDNSKFLEQDTVLKEGYNNYWSNSTVVYGPIWTLICKFVGALSFGNATLALILFKIINLSAHLLSCFLIFKISKKKIFTLLYGLNPLVLIEGIGCVHNDIFVVLFIILALYFLKEKKTLLLSVISLAIATGIKYFAIILLPFIIIYYFREEKPLKRFLKCIEYGVIFAITLIIPYLFYVQDLQILSGLFVQQAKLNKNFYLIIYEYFKDPTILTAQVNHILLAIFTILYFFTCLILLNKKEIIFRKEIRKAHYLVIAFLFIIITNFQPWYVLWIIPFIIWQKADKILWIPQIAIICEFSNMIFLTYGEGWKNGIPFTFTFIVGSLGILIIDKEIRKKKRIKRLLK